MGNGSRAFLAGGLGFAVSFLVACGGGNGLLTSDQASNLSNQLSSVSAAVQSGDCGAAASAARSFNNQVADLPSTISTTLVQNLGQGAATVGELATRDCRNASTSSSTSSSTPTTTSTTTSTSTSTTSTNPTTATNPTSSTSTSTSTTETNPTAPSTSSTSSNGGAGFGATGTGGNGNGQ
jgi:hypothetical protein